MMRIFTKSFLSIAVLLLSLSLTHTSNAQQITGEWNITPPPVNGAYEPGQVIHVCYTLSYFYNGGAANWLHGIVIDFPPGWDQSSITNTSVPATSPGVWLWMPNGVTASNNNGLSWGPGFYYDANSGGGTLNGNPGDNWGVSASTQPPNYTFCFDITVGTDIADGGCGGSGNPLDGNDITPRIQITGDAESGSWGGGIPPEASTTSPTPVVINCCDAESGVPPGNDIIICENGVFNLIDELGAPIDGGGTWSGPAGWTDLSGTAALGTFNPLIDPPGEYTYLVYGTDNCESTTTINMVYNDMGHIGTLTYCESYASNITSIVTGSAAVNITVPPGGTWYSPADVAIPSGIMNPATDSPGLYTYRYYDGGNCPSSFQVLIHFASGGAAGFPGTVDHCVSDGCFQPFYGLEGNPVVGGGWFIYNASGGYLANAPTWNACINLETFANTHNYYGDLSFIYMLDAYPCPPGAVPVTVHVHRPADTGESNEVSLCESDAIVNMETLLGGTPEPGHEWTDASGNVVSNMINPADLPLNQTTNFFYSGGFPETGCYSSSFLQVTVLPENAYAGEDHTITRCQADLSIYMNDEIPDDGVQTVQQGGTWLDAAGENYGGYFIPGDNLPGTYVFTYNVSSSCDADESTLTIILHPSFSAGTSGILDICDNETSVALSSGLSGTVDPGGTWTLGGVTVPATVDGSSVVNGDVYTYTTGAPPCVQSATVTINRMIAPDAGVLTTVPQNYCDSDAEFDLMSLFTTPPSSLPESGDAWWSGPTGIVTSVDPANGSSVSGTYAYSIQNTGCGTASVLVNITVEDTPDAGTDGTLTVCPNDPGSINLISSLGASAAPGGVWTGPLGWTGASTGTFNPGANDPAGVYTYTVGTNCTDEATVTVTYETLPNPGTSTVVSMCSGDPVFALIDYMGDGAVVGTWTLNGTTVGNTFNPATGTPGIYTNTVTAGSCPPVSATLEITLSPVSDSGIDASVSFCETDGNVDLTSYLGGTPQGSGVWENDNGVTVSNPFNIGSVACGNTYAYTYSVGTGDCSASSTLTFTVACVPNAGLDGSIDLCSNDESFSLFDVLNGTYDLTGTWTNSLGSTISNPESMNPSTMGTGDTYTYTVTGAPCTSASANAVVSITPAMTATNLDASCTPAYTDYILSFEITGGTAPYTFVSGNSGTIDGNTFTSNAIVAGTDYEVIISDASSCADLTVSGTSPLCACPVQASFSSSDQTICIGESTDLVFNLTGGTPDEYIFEYSAGTAPPTLISGVDNGHAISVSPAATTTYTLVSVSDGACDGTVSGSVTITVDELNYAGNDVTIPYYCADGSILVLEPAAGEPTNGTFTPASIALTAANSGDYDYVVSGGQCPDDIAVYSISILELAADVIPICEPNQTEYTVEIEISGGIEPYFVDGVQISGTSFVSSIIPMGTDYSFDISDSSTCDDLTVSGENPGCFCEATGSLTGTTSLCLGGSTDIVVNLSGDGPFNITYTSSNPSTPATTLTGINNGHIITVNPVATTTYTLTEIRDAYCYGEAIGMPVTITVDTPINITTSATEICSNTAETYQVQFNYSGGTAPYTFSPANTSTTPGEYLSGPINSGNGYAITVNDAGVCAAQVVSSPAHTCACISDAGSISSGPLVVCYNETISLSTAGTQTLDGNDTLQYILHGGDNTSISNIIGKSSTGEFTFNYSTMTPGTVYYIHAVVGNHQGNGNVNLNDICLSLSNGIEVVMNELTTAAITGGGIVCPGVPVDLTITPTGVGPWDFEYAVDGVTQSMQTITGPFILTVSQPGTYTLVSVSDNNCEGVVSGTALVQNYNPPSATLSGEPTVCENSGDGPEVVFAGDGPWTFVYSINGVDQAPITSNSSTYTIPALVDGTYALVSVESNGCSGPAVGSQDLIILTAPTASITGEYNVCEGEYGTFELDLTGNGPWTVEYTIGGIIQDPLTGITDGYTFDSNIGGDYVIVSVNDANCSGEPLSSQSSLTVNPLPTATITASKNSVCVGESVTLGIDLTGVPPFDVTYVINGDTATATGLYSSFIKTLSPIDPINFEVIYVSDGSNPMCSAYPHEYAYIDALVLPNVPVLTSDTICAYNGAVKIGVNPAPGLSYSWSPETHLSNPNSSKTTFQPTITGPYAKNFEYVLTATNGLCSASDTMTITVDPGPTARFDYSPDPILTEDPTVYFKNKTLGRSNLKYFWEIDSLHTSHAFEPIYKFPDGVNDIYEVTLTAIDPLTGCFNTYSRRLEVKPQMISYVPNAFTPDGDGKNDLWGPVLANVDEDNYKLTVFDRLGEVVFTTKDINQKWNGSYMNDSYFVQPGVYVWIIETKNVISLDEVTMKGIVTLLR